MDYFAIGLCFIGTRTQIKKSVIVYYYKPLVFQIGKGFDGIMQYYAHMSFDLTACSYSREVYGS